MRITPEVQYLGNAAVISPDASCTGIPLLCLKKYWADFIDVILLLSF